MASSSRAIEVFTVAASYVNAIGELGTSYVGRPGSWSGSGSGGFLSSGVQTVDSALTTNRTIRTDVTGCDDTPS